MARVAINDDMNFDNGSASSLTENALGNSKSACISDLLKHWGWYLCGSEALCDYLVCAPREFRKLWRTPTELLVTLRSRLQLQIACRLTAASGSLDGRDSHAILEILNKIIDQRTAQGERSYPRDPLEKHARTLRSGVGKPR